MYGKVVLGLACDIEATTQLQELDMCTSGCNAAHVTAAQEEAKEEEEGGVEEEVKSGMHAA